MEYMLFDRCIYIFHSILSDRCPRHSTKKSHYRPSLIHQWLEAIAALLEFHWGSAANAQQRGSSCQQRPIQRLGRSGFQPKSTEISWKQYRPWEHCAHLGMQTTQRNNHFPCPGAWNPASPNVSRNAFRSSTAHRGSLLINRRATRLDCSARAGPWPKTPLRHVTLMGFSHLVAVRSSYLLWNNANSSRFGYFWIFGCYSILPGFLA